MPPYSQFSVHKRGPNFSYSFSPLTPMSQPLIQKVRLLQTKPKLRPDIMSPVPYSPKVLKLCLRLQQDLGKIMGLPVSLAQWDLRPTGRESFQLKPPQTNAEPHGQSCNWQGPSTMEKGLF